MFSWFWLSWNFAKKPICVMMRRGERVPHFLGSELRQWPRARVLYWYRTPLVVLLDALRQSRRATSLTPSGVLSQYRTLGLGHCFLSNWQNAYGTYLLQSCIFSLWKISEKYTIAYKNFTEVSAVWCRQYMLCLQYSCTVYTVRSSTWPCICLLQYGFYRYVNHKRGLK